MIQLKGNLEQKLIFFLFMLIQNVFVLWLEFYTFSLGFFQGISFAFSYSRIFGLNVSWLFQRLPRDLYQGL